MKNLIFCAFAFKEGFTTSLQTGQQAGNAATEMYLKNIFVALTSAKLYNPNDDVCLVTNCELPADWKERLEAEKILIKLVPFDTFEFPKEFSWALAFYKLCALKAMTEQSGEYAHILLLDADTYTTRSYEELWKEADYGVLLFPVGHSFSHPDREAIRRDFVRLFPEESRSRNLVHYGGEFVAGNPGNLKAYLGFCETVYEKIKAEAYKIEVGAGDETIWSIAAALAADNLTITAAGAYLFRFWTGDFYLTSTVTVSNPVCIWHIPNEKETGFIQLYAYYQKHGAFPRVEKAMAIFGMRRAKRPMNVYTLRNKVAGKARSFGHK